MSSSTPPGFNDKLDGDVGLVGNFVVWSMTLVSGAFLGFRLYIRTLRMQLWWDDRALLAGWLFTIAQSGVFSEMLRRGFAKATIDEPTILLLMLIGDNLQKFALSLTKLSFSLTLLRIFTTGWQKWTIVGLLLVVNSYYIAHLFLVWLNICDYVMFTPNEWNPVTGRGSMLVSQPPSRFPSTVELTKWTVLSAASDFILAFLPLSRMLEVTMKSSDKRAAALITTSVGVIAGLAGLVKGFEGIRLLDTENTRYSDRANGRTKPDFHSIWVFHIVGIAEPNATIVACSIPILRTFFRTQRQLGGERPALPRGRGPYIELRGTSEFASGKENLELEDNCDKYREGGGQATPMVPGLERRRAPGETGRAAEHEVLRDDAV
ncbi:hypothetical protein PG991_009703 [Apiospora marii]|uniref:Rhodopsin domain-containing protein n=1 Tax=Apiospora marii TaxID=335849 RepID=A0ABR1RGR1_9PEZI